MNALEKMDSLAKNGGVHMRNRINEYVTRTVGKSMEMTAEKKLAERIKYYRELRGMTQKDLAERMSRNSARHCHWTTISRWEAGKGLFNITLKKFRLLCAELGVNASKMMKGIR